MRTVTVQIATSESDVDARLRLWRDRWRLAPSVSAREHALTAIDGWLDVWLTLGRFELPDAARDVVIDLRTPVSA